MPRFQTDDTLGDSLPAKRAGTAALGLYYRCGMWASRYTTDGFVPAEVAADYGTAEWVRKLTDAGLWLAVDGGYQMPLFLDDNPSAEKVAKDRQAKAERQARWLEKHRNPSSNKRRVSSASSRPSSGVSIDASRDAAPPLPSPKGEGVDAAPRSGGAAPPTRQIKTTSGRLLCETHHQEIPEGGACKSCAADSIAANVDDGFDQPPPSRDSVRAQLAANHGMYNRKSSQPAAPAAPAAGGHRADFDRHSSVANQDDDVQPSDEMRSTYMTARSVVDGLDFEGRESLFAAARKHLAELGEDNPGGYRVMVMAAQLYQATQHPTQPPPEEE